MVYNVIPDGPLGHMRKLYCLPDADTIRKGGCEHAQYVSVCIKNGVTSIENGVNYAYGCHMGVAAFVEFGLKAKSGDTNSRQPSDGRFWFTIDVVTYEFSIERTAACWPQQQKNQTGAAAEDFCSGEGSAACG